MRYAIYYAASAEDPLMQLGNSWLGRDPFTGEAVAQPPVPGLSAERQRELTTSPRRYGFHATMKPPFALKNGTTAEDLAAAVQSFAEETGAFDIEGLQVTRLGRFLALTPVISNDRLNDLAASCVRHFEPFRAPLDAADQARRRTAGLTEKQDRYVEDWGYPYVFDEFRFHMTLSDKLEDDSEADRLEAAAKEYFAGVIDRSHRIASLGLYFEPSRGAPFIASRIFGLAGAPAEKPLAQTN